MIKNYSKYILLLEEFERKTFKVGDIVRVKEDSIFSGKIGTVIGRSGLVYYVEFDDWLEHQFPPLTTSGKASTIMTLNQLELVENEKEGKIKWYRGGKLTKEKNYFKYIGESFEPGSIVIINSNLREYMEKYPWPKEMEYFIGKTYRITEIQRNDNKYYSCNYRYYLEGDYNDDVYDFWFPEDCISPIDEGTTKWYRDGKLIREK
jgi:hypothetical protein